MVGEVLPTAQTKTNQGQQRTNYADSFERVRATAQYLRQIVQWRSLIFSVAEDGIVCVPILAMGITWATAVAGGMAFGALHLLRYTLLQAILKGVTYALLIYFILPMGLVTMSTGHLAANILVLIALDITLWKIGAAAAPPADR